MLRKSVDQCSKQTFSSEIWRRVHSHTVWRSRKRGDSGVDSRVPDWSLLSPQNKHIDSQGKANMQFLPDNDWIHLVRERRSHNLWFLLQEKFLPGDRKATRSKEHLCWILEQNWPRPSKSERPSGQQATNAYRRTANLVVVLCVTVWTWLEKDSSNAIA